MFRRKVRSALLIDFDNIIGPVGMKDFVASIEKWLAWLEDGKFDKTKRKRQFIEKRVYWNLQFEQFQDRFVQEGFAALSCRSVVRHKKSSADMIMALDALESAFGKKKIDEYVLLTTDTDFVPLLERLGDMDKDTVVTVVEGTASEREYSRHADIVITVESLKGSFDYRRPRNLMQKVHAAGVAARTSVAGGSRRGAQRLRSMLRGLRRLGRRNPVAAKSGLSDLAVAGNHVAELAQTTPGLLLGRKTVVRWLSQHMPQFTTVGASRFLGCSTYAEMLEQIADGRQDLELVRHPNGGIAIRAPAKDEAD